MTQQKYTREFVANELRNMVQEAKECEDYVFINQLFINRPYGRQRFSEWRKTHSNDEEISDAIKKIEDILENRLVVGGLKGKFNPTIAIFTLKNKYGWSNQEKIEQYSAFNLLVENKKNKYSD